MTPGQSLNRILFPLHLRVERLPQDPYDLALYPEPTKPTSPKYLNVGSLDFPHPLWHKLDNPTDLEAFSRKQRGNIDIAHDLMSGAPLPIADHSLAIAYCSHVIEHLTDAHVRALFREIHRTLAPGGTFRVVAPDARLFHDAYMRGDIHFFRPAVGLYHAPTIEQKLLMQFASALVAHHPAQGYRKVSDDEIRTAARSMPMEQFFDHFKAQIPLEVQKQYPADHINWFTIERVLDMLREAGFKNPARSAYMQSHVPVMRNKYLFDPHADHSWFAECSKER